MVSKSHIARVTQVTAEVVWSAGFRQLIGIGVALAIFGGLEWGLARADIDNNLPELIALLIGIRAICDPIHRALIAQAITLDALLEATE